MYAIPVSDAQQSSLVATTPCGLEIAGDGDVNHATLPGVVVGETTDNSFFFTLEPNTECGIVVYVTTGVCRCTHPALHALGTSSMLRSRVVTIATAPPGKAMPTLLSRTRLLMGCCGFVCVVLSRVVVVPSYTPDTATTSSAAGSGLAPSTIDLIVILVRCLAHLCFPCRLGSHSSWARLCRCGSQSVVFVVVVVTLIVRHVFWNKRGRGLSFGSTGPGGQLLSPEFEAEMVSIHEMHRLQVREDSSSGSDDDSVGSGGPVRRYLGPTPQVVLGESATGGGSGGAAVLGSGSGVPNEAASPPRRATSARIPRKSLRTARRSSFTQL